jgi:hypothetical protein
LKFTFANRIEICKEIKVIDSTWKNTEQEILTLKERYSLTLESLLNISQLLDQLKTCIGEYQNIKEEFDRFYLEKPLSKLVKLESYLKVA